MNNACMRALKKKQNRQELTKAIIPQYQNTQNFTKQNQNSLDTIIPTCINSMNLTLTYSD